MGTVSELNQASAAERQGRIELAAAFRLAVRFGFHEGIDNHFSLALTDDGQRVSGQSATAAISSEIRAREPAARSTPMARCSTGDGEVEPLSTLHPRPDACRAGPI